jgi:osmoprotectant transport system permease protein
MVGAILVAALALFIDWLARLVEIAAAPKGVG